MYSFYLFAVWLCSLFLFVITFLHLFCLFVVSTSLKMIFRNVNKGWIGNSKKQDTLLKEFLYKCTWLCWDTFAHSRKQFICWTIKHESFLLYWSTRPQHRLRFYSVPKCWCSWWSWGKPQHVTLNCVIHRVALTSTNKPMCNQEKEQPFQVDSNCRNRKVINQLSSWNSAVYELQCVPHMLSASSSTGWQKWIYLSEAVNWLKCS